MLAELLGGPLDAAILDGPNEMPSQLTVESGGEFFVYRARCCTKCARWRGVMRYEFAGYDNTTALYDFSLDRKDADSTAA